MPEISGLQIAIFIAVQVLFWAGFAMGHHIKAAEDE